jgi:hypothetical protein
MYRVGQSSCFLTVTILEIGSIVKNNKYIPGKIQLFSLFTITHQNYHADPSMLGTMLVYVAHVTVWSPYFMCNYCATLSIHVLLGVDISKDANLMQS